MTAEAGKREDQCVIANLIDQKPVRRNVALAMMAIFAGQCMSPMMRGKLLPPRKCVDDVREQIEVTALLDGCLQVLLELREALINSAPSS